MDGKVKAPRSCGWKVAEPGCRLWGPAFNPQAHIPVVKLSWGVGSGLYSPQGPEFQIKSSVTYMVRRIWVTHCYAILYLGCE